MSDRETSDIEQRILSLCRDLGRIERRSREEDAENYVLLKREDWDKLCEERSKGFLISTDGVLKGLKAYEFSGEPAKNKSLMKVIKGMSPQSMARFYDQIFRAQAPVGTILEAPGGVDVDFVEADGLQDVDPDEGEQRRCETCSAYYTSDECPTCPMPDTSTSG